MLARCPQRRQKNQRSRLAAAAGDNFQAAQVDCGCKSPRPQWGLSFFGCYRRSPAASVSMPSYVLASAYALICWLAPIGQETAGTAHDSPTRSMQTKVLCIGRYFGGATGAPSTSVFKTSELPVYRAYTIFDQP